MAHILQEVEINRHARFPCGNIEFYEWSGDDETKLEAMSKSRPGKHMLLRGMDWTVARLEPDYIASNSFRSSDGTIQQTVTGSLKTSELPDDEVWNFSRSPQIGILDSTPSMIILGDVSYDVFPLGLEVRLSMCLVSLRFSSLTGYLSDSWRLRLLGCERQHALWIYICHTCG